jgi:hypothetical protein
MEKSKELFKMLVFESLDDHYLGLLTFEDEQIMDKDVEEFLSDPKTFIETNKSINAQQIIAIAKAVCELCHFMDENVCPFVRDLP